MKVPRFPSVFKSTITDLLYHFIRRLLQLSDFRRFEFECGTQRSENFFSVTMSYLKSELSIPLVVLNHNVAYCQIHCLCGANDQLSNIYNSLNKVKWICKIILQQD